MSDSAQPHEFLSIPTHYTSDDDLRSPVRPALDTLFSEFARRNRSLSVSTQSSPRSLRNHVRPVQQHQHQPVLKSPTIEFRALEYAPDYDPHLMCPICHVPFIDPVVLDCDHTFCASCFKEHRRRGGNSASGSGSAGERPQCPSCRSYVLSNPRKASRLIYNMCNDIKVRCPHTDCARIMTRGSLEHHVMKECPEQKLVCPYGKCGKLTRRKNYVAEQCVHEAQVECDCGAVIDLGRGEWVKHKDRECPNTCLRCEKCGGRLSSDESFMMERIHQCPPDASEHRCPGAQFGCTDEISQDELDKHTSRCTFARLAPHLKLQSQLLQTLQDQLASSKLRNKSLETELDRMSSLLQDQIQPRLEQLTLNTHTTDLNHQDHHSDHETDIEEIPRDTIPSAAIHHRDLLLPAHIRDLTPSPEFFSSHDQQSQSQIHMHNHLLSLYESLRHTVSNLESDMNTLHHNMAELDARTSMQLMNETLRIKEDLAYTNAALVSHRSQVQWLLNRERMGREQAILRERGRMGVMQMQGQQIQNQIQGQSQGTGSAGAGAGANEAASHITSPGIAAQPSQSYQQSQNDSYPFPTASPGGPSGMMRTTSASGSGSASSSAATSPMFGVSGMVGSRRPSMRGGSQERVKL